MGYSSAAEDHDITGLAATAGRSMRFCQAARPLARPWATSRLDPLATSI